MKRRILVIDDEKAIRDSLKMILESAQMLCTAHRVLDGDEHADNVGMYKMAHKNHPSSIWVRTKYPNYEC